MAVAHGAPERLSQKLTQGLSGGGDADDGGARTSRCTGADASSVLQLAAAAAAASRDAAASPASPISPASPASPDDEEVPLPAAAPGTPPRPRRCRRATKCDLSTAGTAMTAAGKLKRKGGVRFATDQPEKGWRYKDGASVAEPELAHAGLLDALQQTARAREVVRARALPPAVFGALAASYLALHQRAFKQAPPPFPALYTSTQPTATLTSTANGPTWTIIASVLSTTALAAATLTPSSVHTTRRVRRSRCCVSWWREPTTWRTRSRCPPRSATHWHPYTCSATLRHRVQRSSW